MACAATLRRYIVRIRDDLRHVGLVACLAVCVNHCCRMRLVALQALWNLAVHTVAGGASQGRMFALVFLQLRILLRVAAQARFRQVRRESDLKRGMRVLVTTQTTLYFEVGLAHVALTALRDIVF